MFTMDPETNVGFLLHDVSRLMRARFDERAEALGLTRAQWRVLVHLGPRQGINQRSLAEILELDNVTLSRHIDRLERDGWLERRPDPEDRRAWRLYLAEASHPTLKKMEALAAETQAAALSDLSTEQRAIFVETLVRIKASLAPRTDHAGTGDTDKLHSQRGQKMDRTGPDMKTGT
jgi:DNA-binding MarR family transcriptional regulator